MINKIVKLNRTNLKIGFICLALVTVIIRWLCIANPDLVEKFYSRGFFQGVRWVLDHTIFYSRIPMIFVFLFFAILYALSLIVRPFKSGLSIKKRIRDFLFSLTAFLSILYASFMWLWGFNYLRIPIENTMQFSVAPLPAKDLKQKLIDRLPELIKTRAEIPNASAVALDTSFLPARFEELIRDRVRTTLKKFDYPASTKVQGRFLPKGTLLRIKTAGVYFPFVGESNIDAGLHPLQYSETLAHEFAHAYGFGDEGTCSFVAYLSLKDAPDPFVRYSLLLSYWRTLARNYLQYDNQDYQAFRKTLPAEIIADLEEINANRQKYPALFPKSRNLIYDSYLKAQGIKEGLQNYNRVIMLVEGYEN